MKRRLRRFVAVGAGITALDVGVMILLGHNLDWPWIGADATSVVVAAIASFVIHRSVTFSDDVHALIDHQPKAFVSAVGPALVLDVIIVGVGTVVIGDGLWIALVVKGIAILAASWVRLLRYRRVLFSVVRSEQQEASVPFAEDGPRLSVVLPAYNAEAEVADSVRRLGEALEEVVADGGLEIIVADDGSSDGTVAAAIAAGATVVELVQNQGKGGAVRAGMLAATGRSRIFTDVDLAYPPYQLLSMLETLEAGADIVVGSRRHRDTEAVYSGTKLRELGSLGFNLFTHVVLLGQYRDTQSGIKGFRGRAADLIFAKTVVNGFAFDVEVLHLVERYRLGLREIPVVLDNVDETTVRFAADTVKMIREVFAVRRRGARGFYDLDVEQQATFAPSIASRRDGDGDGPRATPEHSEN